MEALIETLVKNIKMAVSDYGYMDQWEILDELSRRISELGDVALKLEYMTEDMEGGDE